MRHLRLLLILAALPALGACAAVSTGKAVAYGYFAGKGNDYCARTDQAAAAALVERFNAGVREEGAKWQLSDDPVKCD